MATLLVEALGIGTGKYESGIAAEIFATFDIDLAALIAGVPAHTPGRAAKLSKVAAEELSRKAPNTGSIVAEVARTSSLLAAMVNEVYGLLSEHEATTTGTTEHFRIAPSDVNDVGLTLSRAFYEEVTYLVTHTVTATLDTLDSKSLWNFVGLDMGVPHGQWPLTKAETTWSSSGVLPSEKRFSLAAGVLQAREAVRHLQARADAEPEWADAARVAGESLEAAERLVQEAERVVTGFASHLNDLAMEVPPGMSAAAYVAERAYAVSPDSPNDETTREVERYLRDGFLGATANFRDGDDRVLHEVGMSGGNIVVNVTTRDRFSSSVASLAAWCVMFRAGLDPGLPVEKRTTPEQWTAWLGQLRIACTEATAWFGTTLVVLQREITGERVLEEVKQLLNLPLWRRRDLLYEVWLLCATLRACERAGWAVTLTGLNSATRAWLLPGSRASEPVAYLVHHPGGEKLEVWREPLRTTVDSRELTPDVTISIPGGRSRDLVVVEAKDRIKMAEGAALEVARRYADALSPRLTWVCNHCDFRTLKSRHSAFPPGSALAEQNHGDPWHAIHLAAVLRPGSVPDVFAETIGAAIRPLSAGDAAQP